VIETAREPRRGGAERLAVLAGWDDTRAAFQRWNRQPWHVVRDWAGTSLLIGMALLLATWLVATYVAGPTRTSFPSFSGARTASLAAGIFGRNLLVLIMHALICVAGYMATQSVQIAAEEYRGLTRAAHRAARPITMGFIVVVTVASFGMQAWRLGHVAPQVALGYHLPLHTLLLALTPHALPELTAMFLPLGAWIVIARRRAWNELFAASILATAIALPLLLCATLVEEFVTPILVLHIAR
jgi:hypothetical protein